MPVNYSRGGMSSLGYQLSKSRKITGFGRKYGRGDKPVEVIEPPKRNRGRPRKNVEPELEEEEGELPASRSRGRPAKAPPVYTSNLLENLNSAIASLRVEERYIKSNVDIPDVIRKEQLKEIKKADKALTSIYLSCM